MTCLLGRNESAPAPSFRGTSASAEAATEINRGATSIARDGFRGEVRRSFLARKGNLVEYVDTLLNLLSDEELLTLFAKVTRAQSVVRWPEQPGDEAKKAQIREIHVRFLAAGFDRGLANQLQDCVGHVRANLKAIAPNGILPSDL